MLALTSGAEICMFVLRIINILRACVIAQNDVPQYTVLVRDEKIGQSRSISNV